MNGRDFVFKDSCKEHLENLQQGMVANSGWAQQHYLTAEKARRKHRMGKLDRSKIV